ncbi:MAG: trimethylamine methyltransferase family protein, partial [Spirochaetota bacterium]
MRVNLKTSESTQFSMLTEDQIEKIFHGTHEVFQRTGININHEEARSILKKEGCRVDGIRVYIPADLVRKALASVPELTLIHHWDGSGVIRVRKNEVYFGPGPTCPNFIDPNTEERRPYKRQDAMSVAKTCDALSNIGFVESLGTVSDVTPSLADVYEFAEMITHTAKPIVAWSYNRATCKDIHQIGIVMAGGEKEFKKRPNYI